MAFPLQPLGFNGGGEDSDSLDTSGETALAKGSPGSRDPMRTEQFLLTMVLQRLQHNSRRRRKALALMPLMLGRLGLDG